MSKLFYSDFPRPAPSVDYGFLSPVEDEDDTTNNENALPENLSRTALLLLDHKQFLAARRIQTLWRGHRVRIDNDRRQKAAVVIQRWWRGFRVRRTYMSGIEARLQQTVIDYYNSAATKIQALFRGWHTRQTVHDMYSLRRQQNCAAEELLTCVAYKLHYLLRTYSIPGVYSLRNSQCLSKVERMLANLTFRFHNDRVTYLQSRQAALGAFRCRQFRNNQFYTTVPYSGPNFNGACRHACEEYLYASKDLDRRMMKIIGEYERSKVDTQFHEVHKGLAARKLRKHVENVLARTDKLKRDFCGDVIASMRKWQIFDNQTLQISRKFIRTPENIENFLKEAASLMDQYNSSSCHCKITTFDTQQCF